jgi:hypothetical protein
MRLKTRDLVERALDEGLSYGIRRLHKYRDAPMSEGDWDLGVRGQLLDHLMDALDEIVADWGDRKICGNVNE